RAPGEPGRDHRPGREPARRGDAECRCDRGRAAVEWRGRYRITADAAGRARAARDTPNDRTGTVASASHTRALRRISRAKRTRGVASQAGVRSCRNPGQRARRGTGALMKTLSATGASLQQWQSQLHAIRRDDVVLKVEGPGAL